MTDARATALALLTQSSRPKIEPIFTLGVAFSEIRANFQNCHICVWNLAISQVPEILHIPTFYPRGTKLSLFSLYGQRFPRYGQIFKIDIFGHETRPLAKVPKIVLILCKLPPPSPKFYSVLLYGWPFPWYRQFCILPLGSKLNMLNFNIFFKSLNLKRQNSKKQVLCGLLFGQKGIKTVGGVAFEIFTPIGSHVKENFNLFFLNLKFQNSYKHVLWGLPQGICRKVWLKKNCDCSRIVIVGEVAFWNFQSHRVPC